MSQHKYVVHLNPQQRDFLSHVIRSETRSTLQKMHAQVLLQTDRNQPGGKPPTDEQVAQTLNISNRTVLRVKARFLQKGLMRALHNPSPNERPGRRKLSEEQEAQLVSLAYSRPPAGHKRWRLQLLADQMVQLQIVESISKETVRQILKRMHVSLLKTPLGNPLPRKRTRPAQKENPLQAFLRLVASSHSVDNSDDLSKLLTLAQTDTFSLPMQSIVQLL